MCEPRRRAGRPPVRLPTTAEEAAAQLRRYIPAPDAGGVVADADAVRVPLWAAVQLIIRLRKRTRETVSRAAPLAPSIGRR